MTVHPPQRSAPELQSDQGSILHRIGMDQTAHKGMDAGDGAENHLQHVDAVRGQVHDGAPPPQAPAARLPGLGDTDKSAGHVP